MIKTFSGPRAKRAFSKLVGRVSSRKDTIIVKQGGKPIVAMIDFDRYQALTTKRERLFGVLDRVWARNRSKSSRRAYRDATLAVSLARGGSSPSRRRRSA